MHKVWLNSERCNIQMWVWGRDHIATQSETQDNWTGFGDKLIWVEILTLLLTLLSCICYYSIVLYMLLKLLRLNFLICKMGMINLHKNLSVHNAIHYFYDMEERGTTMNKGIGWVQPSRIEWRKPRFSSYISTPWSRINSFHMLFI